jgi:exopolysaccharide production protein ExoZ
MPEQIYISSVHHTRKIESIEMGRGLAALAVLLLHAEGMLLPARAFEPAGFGGVFRYGFLGVDFFFVLSGFIIYFTHHRDLGSPARIGNYILRRLFRILPAYWAVFAMMLILLPFQRNWPNMSLAWLSLQLSLTDLELWVGQAWTLQHELIFYGLFAFSIWHRHIGICLIALWVSACMAINWGAENVERGSFTQILFHPYHLMFILGMISAHAYRVGGRIWYGWLVFSFSFSALLIVRMIDIGDDFRSHSFLRYAASAGMSNTVLLGLLVYAKIKLPVPHLLSWLGKISYSVYLAHGVVLMAVSGLIERFGLYTTLSRPIIFLAGVGISIFVSAILQRLIEQPGVDLGKRVARWFSTKIDQNRLTSPS